MFTKCSVLLFNFPQVYTDFAYNVNNIYVSLPFFLVEEKLMLTLLHHFQLQHYVVCYLQCEALMDGTSKALFYCIDLYAWLDEVFDEHLSRYCFLSSDQLRYVKPLPQFLSLQIEKKKVSSFERVHLWSSSDPTKRWSVLLSIQKFCLLCGKRY